MTTSRLKSKCRTTQSRDWTAANLVKYLVNAQDNLSLTDMEQLQLASVFMKEANSSGGRDRFRASELYEPRDIFRQMELPVIDWGTTTWRGSSEQGEPLRSK